MVQLKRLVFFFLSFIIYQSKCSKILGVFPGAGFSQYILGEALMKALAKKGHDVTVISPYGPKENIHNYKAIKADKIISLLEGFNLFELENSHAFSAITSTYQMGALLTECTLEDDKVQELIHSSETFDLVIVEEFFDDALKGFAKHFNAPLVLFSSMGLVEWNKHSVGYPALPTINPIHCNGFTNEMTFIQRFKNIIDTVFNFCYTNLVIYPQHQNYLTKYFPKDILLQDIIHNVSLILMNSHVTTSENTLLPYNMIEIGGFHISKNTLSEDIQNLLDQSVNGAILFSMGSNLRSSDISNSTLAELFSVFRKLKQNILWKFDKDIENKPKNVFISKWFKQSDILAHPNVRLFITHGGLLSTTEAITYGVPMVGIPIFGDQKMNMARAQKNKIANVIPFQELTAKSFSDAINETINNLSYNTNAKAMSKMLNDRVIHPLDHAIYSIEYVIRHNGLHFKLATLDRYFFEIYMIDIVLFLLCLLFIIVKLVNMSILKNKKNKSKLKKQ